MALTFSNSLSPSLSLGGFKPVTSPQSAALTNKINPQPLGALSSLYTTPQGFKPSVFQMPTGQFPTASTQSTQKAPQQVQQTPTQTYTPSTPPQSMNTTAPTPPTAPSASLPQTPPNQTATATQAPLSQNQGLISSLTNFAQNGSPQYNQAQSDYTTAVQNLANFNQNLAKQYGGIESQAIPLEFQQGREQVLARQAASQQQALQGAVTQQQNAISQAQTAQGQQLNAFGQAISFTQPQLQFGQLTNPQTGQVVGADQSGNNPTLSNAISTQAQRLQSGNTTYPQAQSDLSGFGQAGVNALNQKLGSGFNVNASTAAQGTTATGQQIQTAANSTNQALNTLTDAFNSLNPAEKIGIPLTTGIANWIAGQFGSGALSKYKTALADARSQLIGVLNSSGGTPTGNEQTALQYLPDNMTMQQFMTNVGTADKPGIVRQLMAQKVGAFTQSAIPSGSAGGTTSSIWSW